MARRSSKSSGSTRSMRGSSSKTDATAGSPEADSEDTIAATDSVSAETESAVEEAETLAAAADETLNNGSDDTPADGSDAVPAPDDDTLAGAAGDDTLAGDAAADTISAEPQDDDGTSVDADDSTTAEASETTAEPEAAPEPEPEPTPAPPPAPDYHQSSGPGFVPLVLGGIVAAGIGYGAAYLGYLPTGGGNSEQSEAIAAALEAQSETLTSLQGQVTELANAEPVMPEIPEIPEVDLSPVMEQIDGLSTRINSAASTMEEIANRVTVLEERPVFTGNVDEDNAAAVAAVGQLEAELRAQQEAAEAEAAALEAAAAEAATAAEEAQAAAQAAAAEAEAAIAAAEAEAAANMARAAAEAALGDVRIALANGTPFAEPLAVIADSVEVPESLATAAETGVPTLDALIESFVPAARAALPIALREEAGDGAADRVTAFLMGQVGGRSVEPREGTDPDAILSRVPAAVEAGDLDTALAEIEALPDGAEAEMAAWVAQVEARAAVDAALNDVAAALGGAN